MDVISTIIISLVTGVVSGIISGVFVMRKSTHDAKRVYAKQMHNDFDTMSSLAFSNARLYLESLGYKVDGIEAYKPSTRLKENLAAINRVRNKNQIFDYRRLETYQTQKLVAQVNDLMKYTIEETPGVKGFLNTYLVQSAYFDGLCEASSTVELVKFWQNEIPHSNEEQVRICVSNVTTYLLQLLDALLKAGSEIEYYSNAKSWTWSMFMLNPREGGTLVESENRVVKVVKPKKKWWKDVLGQLLVGASQLFYGLVLTGMVLYLVAQYKTENFQPFELATVAGLLGGFPLVAAFGDKAIEEGISKKLKILSALYLLSAISFVVFGFYLAADEAKLLPVVGAGVWTFKVVYLTSFYTGAIAMVFAMWATLGIIPQLMGLGSVMERVKKIFGKYK